MYDQTRLVTARCRKSIFRPENREILTDALGDDDFMSLQTLCSYVIIERIHECRGNLRRYDQNLRSLRVSGNNEGDLERINRLNLPPAIKRNIRTIRYSINEILIENDLKEFEMHPKAYSLLGNWLGNMTTAFCDQFTMFYTVNEHLCDIVDNYCKNCYFSPTDTDCLHTFADYTLNLRVGFKCRTCYKRFKKRRRRTPYLLKNK